MRDDDDRSSYLAIELRRLGKIYLTRFCDETHEIIGIIFVSM